MIRIILSTELGKRRWTQAKLARKTKIRPSTITFYYNDITVVNLSETVEMPKKRK